MGGFGACRDFSWEVVATYAFNVNGMGTPLRTVIGYGRLLSNSARWERHGRSGIDWIKRGPVMGITIR